MTKIEDAPTLAVGSPVDRGVRPQCVLTPWFPVGVLPVRDGVYLCRHVRAVPSDCWHALRWHGATGTWYSADSVGADDMDVIGHGANADAFQWRGLAA